MANASRDENRVTTLMGINNVTGLPQEVLVDSNGRILVSAIVVASDAVTGPVTSTVGALALWGDATGDTLTDSTVKLVTGVLSPVTSDGVALGSGTLMWADLFLASGSVINWNNGDLTLTHSANTLTLAGGDLNLGANILIAHSLRSDATDGVLIESANGTDVAILGAANTANALFYGAVSSVGAVLPSVDNTPALGASGQAWADLFLGSGAIINFNAGDVTITHSANALDIDGGVVDFGSTPTVNAAAIYFTGGTDVAIADGGTGASTAAGAFTNLKQAASDTATGVVELAIASEVTTGTDATRAITPDAFAGSDYGIRFVEIVVVPAGTATAVGDGAGSVRFFVPAQLNGYNLVAAHAAVITAGTTNTTDIQIANVTQAADMLTTKITIDSGEKTSYTAATPPVIDAANDDVATGDELRIDVDAISTTPAQGLVVILGFQLP